MALFHEYREPGRPDPVVPGELPSLDLDALRRQVFARRLQAGYLIFLLAAPLVRIAPVPFGDRTGFDTVASAVLLIAAVLLRWLMRAIAADADWVRARLAMEESRADVWRRCMAGEATADDSVLARTISGSDAASRWTSYRQHRLDDQITYFEHRVARHRRKAQLWRVIRIALTIGTVAIALLSLVISVSSAVIGLVSAMLASAEAWLQFQRGETLQESYSRAREALAALRDREPADEAALTDAVMLIERVLDRERWIWTAIMSATVLTGRISAGTSAADTIWP